MVLWTAACPSSIAVLPLQRARPENPRAILVEQACERVHVMVADLSNLDKDNQLIDVLQAFAISFDDSDARRAPPPTRWSQADRLGRLVRDAAHRVQESSQARSTGRTP